MFNGTDKILIFAPHYFSRRNIWVFTVPVYKPGNHPLASIWLILFRSKAKWLAFTYFLQECRKWWYSCEWRANGEGCVVSAVVDSPCLFGKRTLCFCLMYLIWKFCLISCIVLWRKQIQHMVTFFDYWSVLPGGSLLSRKLPHIFADVLCLSRTVSCCVLWGEISKSPPSITPLLCWWFTKILAKCNNFE
jgi:hypothetical protein